MNPASAILIVEDERIFAKDLQQTLGRLGYDVRPISSTAEDAIASAAQRCPDLVLMDVRIKGKRDGIEAAQILQRDFGVPVVYLTAYADDATLERAKHTEPYGYLVKPVRPAELRSVIELALYRHEMDRRSRERERSASALRSLGDAVIAVDLAGNITYMNSVAERLTQRALGELAGHPIGELVRELDASDAWQSGARELAREASPESSAPATLSSASDRGGVDLGGVVDRGGGGRAVPPLLDDGRQLGSVMVLRDVTEQKLAQKQLELTDRLSSMQTLAAGVAHEVNNSLAVIIANGEFVLGELRQLGAELVPPDAPRERQARVEDVARAQFELQAAAQRIHRVMSDLKAFSRPVAPATGEADVRRALGWAMHATARELSGRARLTTRVEELPPVQADEAQLGQALAHLLMNAAQAVSPGDPAHQEVSVAAHVDASDGVVVEIRDSGPGLSPEVQAHVFEPFFPTDPSGARSGLGLAVCHGLIRSCGGEILVDSSPGRGSTFRIRLPLAARSSRVVPGQLWSEEQLRGRILVVDDNELVCRSIQRMLRDQNITVAEDGRRALELLQANDPFDLILTDVVMPNMGGIELYETLLARDPDLARRVVFMSGGTLTARADDFFRAVPNRRIEKPFTAAQLLDVVQQSLATRLPQERRAAARPGPGLSC